MKNSETINKYLAGLVDADGTITVNFYKSKGVGYKPTLKFILGLSLDNVKSEETLLWLYDNFPYGSINRRHTAGTHKNSNMITWVVSGDNAMSIINRFKKHLVIKGTHANRMIELFLKYKGYGNTVKTEEELSSIKEYVKDSRDNTTSIKYKNHLTWAWLAGYTDGDGYIGFNEANNNCCIDYNCHIRDISALEIISRAFGREIIKDSRGDYLRLRHYIGRRSKALADRMLKPMLPHLRIKKWDAEQVLRIIRRD